MSNRFKLKDGSVWPNPADGETSYNPFSALNAYHRLLDDHKSTKTAISQLKELRRAYKQWKESQK